LIRQHLAYSFISGTRYIILKSGNLLAGQRRLVQQMVYVVGDHLYIVIRQTRQRVPIREHHFVFCNHCGNKGFGRVDSRGEFGDSFVQ